MNILGISAFYHDSAACMLCDGKIVAAAQEERFSRKKHDPSFPAHATRYCLEHAGLEIDELDAIVFYDKPLLKFERLLETYYAFAPRGARSFITAMPVWMKEKLFLKKLIKDELKNIQPYDAKKLKLIFPEHHLSHAASAFYPSPFEDAAILTIDGVGEWATASICHGKGKDITILKELKFPHSVGLLYSAFTYYLGFRVNSGEYKLMGLAPYGNPGSKHVENFKNLIREKLVKIYDDGSVWLNQDYFNYCTGLTMIKARKWRKLFGLPRRNPESPLTQIHCDLAMAIQQVTEEIVLKMARTAQALTHSDYLCLAGGVALNCVANGKILGEGIFKDIFIQPASGDAGGALGGALAANHIYFGNDREISKPDAMQGAYLGPDFDDKTIQKVIRKYRAGAIHYDDPELLCDKVASLLNEGHVVGWVQDRMEFGPRALGTRSILGDPRNPEMQKKLNLKIKYRESFRPFAPAVPEDRAGEFFEIDTKSPYMLLVRPVQQGLRNDLPEGYADFDLKEKLYYERSRLPAITHIDFSARIQTVSAATNPMFHKLLRHFEKLTGTPILVNTSFNVRGEPIVCTPEDAYRCFMRTEMDALVIGDFLFVKANQPEWKEKDNWKTEFVLD